MATARRRLSPVKQRHLDGRIAERGLYSSPAPAGTALAGEPVARGWEERAVDSGNSGNAPCHARCSPRAFRVTIGDFRVHTRSKGGKATQTAEILATSLGIDFKVRPAMHENDRSATGFLEPKEFEAAADQFFAHPTKSVRGWETAVRAQVRIVTEVEDALSGLAETAIFSLSAMELSGPCSTATMRGSRSAGSTINPPAAATTSPSA